MFTETHGRRTGRSGRSVVAGVLCVVLAGSGLAAGTAEAAKSGFPMSYNPETAAGFTNTFSTKDTLSPQCPNALAATPGSDPASKVLNATLNTASSFQAGGTVHFIYKDNPHPNGGTQNFTIQDCVVTYPAGTFTAGQIDPATGVVSGISKNDLKGGTQIDGASLSGINSSQGDIYYSWTAPADLVVNSFVCFFARDIRNNHGGGGNRKVPPTCYQVTEEPPPPNPNTNLTPDISFGYADDLHEGTPLETPFNPNPWSSDPKVVFLGCMDGAAGCTKFDAGAILIHNAATNGPLTLTAAKVNITSGDGTVTCAFHPWDALLAGPGRTAGPDQSFVLTQTGAASGIPQAAPCDTSVDPTQRAITNFDTSEGTQDNAYAAPPIYRCAFKQDPLSRPAIVTLKFTNGSGSYTLVVKDAARILTTGGEDRFACSSKDEATPFTPVPDPATNVVRT